MINLEKKSTQFRESDPEEPVRISLVIEKLHDGQFYLQPNYDEGARAGEGSFSAKDIVQLGTRLAKYLSSKPIIKYKPLLSIKCNGFSRDEKGLIRSIFNLYSSSRD